MRIGHSSFPLTSTAYIAVFFVLCMMSCGLMADVSVGQPSDRKMGDKVNHAQSYPAILAKTPLKCTVDLSHTIGSINPRLFGTNLEWFNDAGGLTSKEPMLKEKITQLAKSQGVTVMRFPGGTLADFYDWRDGIGPVALRPNRKHPTDSGISNNDFGSPEFFRFLQETHSEGLVTVNVGTGTAKSAADWVAYANQAQHVAREKDGFKAPVNIKLWEIGNELYLPGNPGEKIITLTPEVYAQRYLEFSRAIKKVDPTVTTIAIGVAKSHIGPDTQYPLWTKILLEKAGKEIDMIAVHNAYFPVLIDDRQPHVKEVYAALLASPEAVDQSIFKLEKLISQYEGNKKIGIAITEWGGLFSFPDVNNDWLDHVKTMGTGVYVARMMQVMMAHPRVELANYFKLTDRSFMGWINYAGEPKVPFWVFALYANYSGKTQLKSDIISPTYHAPSIGIIAKQNNVPEVTVMASQDTEKKKIYVNFVNRSLTTQYPISLEFLNGKVATKAKILRIEAKELTAHNGRDIPPEWPYEAASEPYTTMPKNSIKIKEASWDGQKALTIAPFSVMTIVFNMVV